MRPAVTAVTALSTLLLAHPAACGGTRQAAGLAADAAPPADAATSDDGSGGTVTQQMVFMMYAGDAGAPVAPGPDAVYEIAVMNLDGGALKQVTSDGKFKFLPHFSPDGTRLVYTKYAVGGYGSPDAQADVAVFDLASGKETMVTRGGASVQGTWSPDGTRIAYLAGTHVVHGGIQVNAMWVVGTDGSNGQKVAAADGGPDDMSWGDIAWSSDDWILFSVSQTIDGCFKVRTDKIRPDGSSRTQVSDGGPNCTPMGFEQSGDADPGWSHDGKTIYTSRGFPTSPAGVPDGGGMPRPTERKLYAFASDAWHAGKPEVDLSLPSEPDCIEGVPKGSPDGTQVLLFRACFDHGAAAQPGIYVTDNAGSYRRFVTAGFGPDWNPVAR
jgi:Tol biopolymer transport system component